jgi:hypothetical protein
MQVIQSATGEAAGVLGIDNSVGMLVPGPLGGTFELYVRIVDSARRAVGAR